MQTTLETLIGYIIYQNPKRKDLLKKLNEILLEDKTEKSKYFVRKALQTVEEESKKYHGLVEIPYNLKNIIINEPESTFSENRFLKTEAVRQTTEEIIRILKVQKELQAFNIEYTPTLLLYGESGCGKTMLAKYIAKEAQIPYYYIRFSSLIDSHMGVTSKNIETIFEFFRKNPGVICIDEIDTIGLSRTKGNDGAEKESNRIVITLMQEIEKNVPNSIVIATTNREDCLDKALKRRFTKIHEILPFTFDEARQYVAKFLEGIQKDLQNCTEENSLKKMYTFKEGITYMCTQEWLTEKLKEIRHEDVEHIPAYIISRICIESLVTELMQAKQKQK